MPVIRCGAVMRPSTTRSGRPSRRWPRTRAQNGVEAMLARRRRPRGPGRVGHRPGRVHARRSRCGASATAPSFTPGSRSPRVGRATAASSCRGAAASGRMPRRRQLRRPRRRRRRAVARATTPSTSTPARASSSSSTRPAAGPWSGSSCRCRRRAPRACSSFRRSTARSSPARPRTTRRTAAIGRCAPRRAGEILPKAAAMMPELRDAEPIASYAGLRPAGRAAPTT